MNTRLENLEETQIADQGHAGGTNVPEPLVPITQTTGDDIFVAGLPKSGNTWFQCLLAGLVYDMEVESTPDAVVQKLVPDVHCNQAFKRNRDGMFFKTHDVPKPHHRRVVHLLRDGRDVMVSYFHYLITITRNENLDFLELVRNGKDLFPCKWHEHTQKWLANPYEAEILRVKYEDLKSDPLNEMRNLCRFAGLERDDEFLKTVIDHASFDSMRRREVELGWNGSWPKEKYFVRRGKVGSYQDEMPEPVLKYFMDEARGALRDCGYL